MGAKLIKDLHNTIASLQSALNEEVDKVVLGDASGLEKMVDESPGDISSRYWLMQFLEPLSRKEIKSVVDGFLVQLLNEDQSKKLVKFLLVRFPGYYKDELMQSANETEDDRDLAPSDDPILASKKNKTSLSQNVDENREIKEFQKVSGLGAPKAELFVKYALMETDADSFKDEFEDVDPSSFKFLVDLRQKAGLSV